MHKTQEQILFIINPISGVKKKDNLPSLIKTCLSKKSLPYTIEFTSYPGHATKLTKQAVLDGYKFIVAAGGDGTINEVASVLINKSAALGIIPLGSGNGLARHLKIPIDMQKAVENISELNVQSIDTCLFNNMPFFCTAGIGFDALVSHEFAKNSKRGFRSYIKTTLRKLKKYVPKKYIIETENKKMEVNAFSLTVANAAQFGNNAFISPKSSIIDGKMELCIIKPFPKRLFPIIALRLFTKSLNSSKYSTYLSCKKIRITNESTEPIHLDGEPIENQVNQASINIQKHSLQIIHSRKIKR